MANLSFLKFLALPQADQLTDLDDASTTVLHRDILNRKPFLRRIYQDYYEQMQAAFPNNPDGRNVLEIGSGAGFIKEVLPESITSDLIVMDGLDVTASALQLPFADQSLDGIVMINVLHHLPDVEAFFRESRRCLKPGAKIVMIEPANTLWSRFVYTYLHHEPFDPKGGWTFPPGGRLTDANVALPWIVFKRDRDRFAKEFPEFEINRLKVHSPFIYLLSGGFTMKALVPAFSYGFFKFLGRLISPLNGCLGMFMTVEILRKD